MRVAIIGAGMAGLAAALRLALAGCTVTVLEQASTPGGKLRQIPIQGRRIDSGPTVLTMRWVFEDLFAAAGTNLADHVHLLPLATLARHFWPGGAMLDLHADPAASTDAIAQFAGPAEAQGYAAFMERARRCHEVLRDSFMTADRPTPLTLAWRTGPLALRHISPFQTLWQALADHFQSPRLRQLFGRYATYCGAVPMQAPATLMLVAHVESQGVWIAPEGLHSLATAIASLAAQVGATFRYAAEVTTIEAATGRVSAVHLATGERIPTDAVIATVDAAALSTGLLGPAARTVKTDPTRSLSALTVSAIAQPHGAPLLHHNVFFSDAYEAEFTDIAAGRLPRDPSVYICAADRQDTPVERGPERLFGIINAPAVGDSHQPAAEEIAQCQAAMIRQFQAAGLEWGVQEAAWTTPKDFARLYPATGGALYGPATHGPYASFRRPASHTKLPGLYLAGGSVHPGPGLPMAALSGKLAAMRLLRDLASASR